MPEGDTIYRTAVALRTALLGKKMVDYACLVAKEKGVTQVLALSTQNFGFFIDKCGFTEATKGILPEARLKTYEESGRNPKVLVRQL